MTVTLAIRDLTRSVPKKEGSMARRGDVTDMDAWLRRNVQTAPERRVHDGDEFERLRANRAIVALRRVARRIGSRGTPPTEHP